MFVGLLEMEFLDGSMTAPSYRQILKKTILILSSGFINPHKKIRETRKLEPIHEQRFVEQKNESRQPDKNSSLCPET
jgi:hypothetical protein